MSVATRASAKFKHPKLARAVSDWRSQAEMWRAMRGDGPRRRGSGGGAGPLDWMHEIIRVIMSTLQGRGKLRGGHKDWGSAAGRTQLWADDPKSHQAGGDGGHAKGHANGHVDGHANGHHQANGHANGETPLWKEDVLAA